MASTLKVDQIETPSGVGNISFAQPISGDGSQLTGVGLAVGGGAVVAGDFLYHDGVEWTRLPKGTAAQYLRMNAGATAPEWIATSGAGIQEPAASAEGDILYYDGSNYVRLAKGTAGQQLAINAGATAPEWIAPATAGAGKIVKYETFQTTTYSTGSFTGTGSISDGIPQLTEGHNCMTLAFTPTNGSNILMIQGTFFGSVSGDGNPWVGLFQDTTADAIAAWRTTNGDSAANTLGMYSFFHQQSCGDTSARDYHVRIGGATTGTAYFLGGQSSGRKLGGAGTGTMVIYELEV